MLENLGRFSIKRRRFVIILAVVLAVAAGILGSGVFSRLSDEGFIPDNAEFLQGDRILSQQFDIEGPDILFLVEANGSVDDPTVAHAASAMAARVAKEDHVRNVQSYWTTPGATALKSDDGTKGLITLELANAPDGTLSHLVETYSGSHDGLTVLAGGGEVVGDAIGSQVSEDLAKAESIAMPIVLILLVIVFGGLIAAFIPVMTGVLSILGAFFILYLFTLFTDVSIFSINLVTMVGLGLGIDYSLFIVSRYREELRKGLDRTDALLQSVSTAGRTVLFSAVAIAVSLASLLVFPIYFLRSFAYAGIAVVALSAVTSVVLLPAVLAAVGPRIDKWQVIKGRSIENPSRFWGGVAHLVMKRPLVVLLTTTLALVLLASPFVNVRWGPTDDRVLPKDAPSHVVSQAIRDEFPQLNENSLTAVTPTLATAADVSRYAAALSRVSHVAAVDSTTGRFVRGERIGDAPQQGSYGAAHATAFKAFLDIDDTTTSAANAARDMRAVPAPFTAYVTGDAAFHLDSDSPIRDNLWKAGLLLAAASFVVLFLMTRSIVLPLKAIVLAGLSLTASLGAIVWIFQYGHFASFLEFTATGALDPSNVLVMFCIAFGLSMDYEVFLMSRMKEEHDRTGDTSVAITRGLERTGRLITAAALLISVVFLAFATSGISFIKLIGLGLAIAIIVDATVVRGLLVPAFMRLMGNANWWAPKFLRHKETA